MVVLIDQYFKNPIFRIFFAFPCYFLIYFEIICMYVYNRRLYRIWKCRVQLAAFYGFDYVADQEMLYKKK